MSLKEKIYITEVSYLDFKKNPDNYIAPGYPVEFVQSNKIKKGKIIKKYNASQTPETVFIYSDTDNRNTSCKFSQIRKINNHTING